MGFADLVQAEETVSIKISEYRELIENNTELDMLRQVSNGTAPEVCVRILRKGCETAFSEADREELRAYRETGITPDRFQVIDDEYQKLSKEKAWLKEEAARLTEEKAKLFDQVKTLEQKCKGLEESSRNYSLGCGKKQGQIDAMGAQIAELREAIQEKTGTIRDLRCTIQERDTQIADLKGSNRDLREELRSKLEEVEGLCSTIQEKTAQIDELESTVKSKQEYIDRLLWGMAHGVKVENDGE